MKPILRKDFDAVMRFWHCSKPTIASVRGPCLAGAFELSLACDMTIASETAFFGEPELKFGAGIVVMLLPGLSGRRSRKRSSSLAKIDCPLNVRVNLGSSTRSFPTPRSKRRPRLSRAPLRNRS